MDLEQSAFEALRFASAQSLKLYEQPLMITYSGGKDSDVLLRLAENSGIPFEVLHSLTTADAPETVYHVRKTFRKLDEKGIPTKIDCHVQPNGKRITMWNLIPKKLMPPTRQVRYCCSILKEGGGKGRFIATGVRWAESPKRQNVRGLIEVQTYANLLVQVTRPVETINVDYDMNTAKCLHIDEFARGYIVSEFVQQLNDRNFIRWEERDGILYASLKVVRQP